MTAPTTTQSPATETTSANPTGESAQPDAQSTVQPNPQPAAQHANLADATPNSYIDGVYSLINPQVGSTRAGKPFLKCLIRDATGEAPARMWSFEEGQIQQIAATGFVWIAGSTQLYNGQIQIILEQIKSVEVGPDELKQLLPTTRHDINDMFDRLTAKLGTLEHPAMKALAEAYLGDEQLMANFKTAPAAMTLHHAWIGGLLEHTLQLIELADAMLPLYPRLNRDIVLMGLFLHDIGKTTELSWDKGFDYTEDGNLIGHVVRGAIWLQFKAAVAAKKSGQKLPSEALRVLQHIIISHHGKGEFGAAKIPATPEAIFVSHLDDLDAKTTIALCECRAEGTAASHLGDFTDKLWALETRLYRPDPLKK